MRGYIIVYTTIKLSYLTNNVFLNEFLDFLTDFVPLSKNIIITGDFNIHVNDCENQDGSCLNDNINAMGYDQHVQFPTHRSGHTLDLVITEHHSNMKVISCDAGSFISDHCSVEFILSVEKENILSETKTFRDMKDADLDALNIAFGNISLQDHSDIDSMVNRFEMEASNILDHYVPEVTRTVIQRKPKPWFNNQIKDLKKQLRRRERVWRKYQEPHQWIALKKLRNQYVK